MGQLKQKFFQERLWWDVSQSKKKLGNVAKNKVDAKVKIYLL